MNEGVLFCLCLSVLLLPSACTSSGDGGSSANPTARSVSQEQATPPQNDGYRDADSTYVVYYVGSPTCGVCTKPSVQKAVSSIPPGFSAAHALPAKYVFASMAYDRANGFDFAMQHGAWDEITVGARYNNEVLLHHFNDEEGVLPAVPHVLVYRDTYQFDEHNIPQLRSRSLVKSIFGGTAVVSWVDSGYAL